MEYQLEERTRDMQDMLESCQTKVCLSLHVTVQCFTPYCSGNYSPTI